jgi:hypothetical protein
MIILKDFMKRGIMRQKRKCEKTKRRNVNEDTSAALHIT